jgi:RES domain-containing protein
VTRTFDPRFLDFLEQRVREGWRREVWRIVLGDTDPLRPNERGARWNPPGVEALYCSLELETAQAEIDYLVSRQSIPVRKRQAVRLKVELSRVVDLSDPAEIEEFGLTESDIPGGEHAKTQIVGRAVAWLGCGGLLVRSVRHVGTNLVIFTNRMDPKDSVELAES